MNMDRHDLQTPTDYFPVKSYLIDQSDQFVWFSPEWNLEFQALFPEPYEVSDYLGQNFFDLLAGPDIKLLYRSIFNMIRQSASERLSLTMRCDRVPIKILMSQEIHRQADGQIKIQFAYLSREPMDMVASKRRWPEETPLKMCSWCQAIFDSEHNLWLSLEKALGCFPLLHDSELPAFTHGCCSVCFQLIRGNVYEYSRGG